MYNNNTSLNVVVLMYYLSLNSPSLPHSLYVSNTHTHTHTHTFNILNTACYQPITSFDINAHNILTSFSLLVEMSHRDVLLFT